MLSNKCITYVKWIALCMLIHSGSTNAQESPRNPGSQNAEEAKIQLFTAPLGSDQSKKELYLDSLYYSYLSNLGKDRILTIFGDANQAFRNLDDFFYSNIQLIDDGSIGSCLQGDASSPCPKGQALLDDHYLVTVIPSPVDGIKIKGKRYEKSDGEMGIATVRGGSMIEGTLGPEAKSVYRISNMLGLAYLNYLRQQSPPLTACQNLLSDAYSCDANPFGPYSAVGKTMLFMTNLCHSCSEADDLTLRMVADHYLLRARDNEGRQLGIDMFSTLDDKFKSIGVSYSDLKNIYQTALTK